MALDISTRYASLATNILTIFGLGRQQEMHTVNFLAGFPAGLSGFFYNCDGIMHFK